MREILFRGKRIDDGEWVEGYLFSTKEHTYIAYQNQFDDDLFLSPKEIFIEVDPHNVWQYTGLTDKNGKKIFEGDIVTAPFIGYISKTVIRKGIVAFMKGAFSVSWEDEMYGRNFAGYVEDIEVIGNLYDNPELIGKE